MLIDSKIRFGAKVDFGEVDRANIKNEVMLFNNDFGHAYNADVLHGIPNVITREALDHLDPDWHGSQNLVIDSRVHMLMKNWYPCIPGYHHDDVPRTRSDGQPNYHDELRSEHAILLLNAHMAPTEFAVGEFNFNTVPLGETVYKEWHKVVVDQLRLGQLDLIKAPDAQWVYFDDRTWHQGVGSNVEFGWRFFIRVSRYYRMIDGEKVYGPRGNPRTNEVRRQVQVYMDDLNQGW